MAKPIDWQPPCRLVYMGRYKTEHPIGGVSVTQFIFTLSNGEIQATVSSKELRASAELQNKYLGVA